LLQEGLTPAILSRGYRSQGEKSNLLVSDGRELLASVRMAGDEAWMLAQQVPQALVAVGRRRDRSARLVLEAAEDANNVVFVLEDGFQHLRLKRDLDLLLLEASDPLAGGRVLPAGRLREPLQAARRADVLMLTRCHLLEEASLSQAQSRVRRLHPEAPILRVSHRPKGWVEIPSGEERPLDRHPGRRALALAALARPRQFAEDLRRLSLEVAGERFFRDHHWYRQREVESLIGILERGQADFIATTEKDAVRLADLALPPGKIFALRIESYCHEEEELRRLLHKALR
ncbi:MAG TPA: tetraacyldisaccharide 4'-kinase, partial [Acidobacteriota bacterium]|nr:tetraacyldisaccharide 4'-kinase [Acidobacteriota bacterium]